MSTPENGQTPQKPKKTDTQDQNSNDEELKSSGPASGGGNWRSYILFGTALMLLLLFLYSRQQNAANITTLSYRPDFEQLLAEGRIKSARFVTDTATNEQILTGKYLHKSDKQTHTTPKQTALHTTQTEQDTQTQEPSTEQAPPAPVFVERDYKVVVNTALIPDLEARLERAGVPTLQMEYTQNVIGSAILALLPLLLILLVIYLIFRQQIRSAGKGAFNFGKSRSKLITKDKNRVLFKDVAGIDEAKEEVTEIVEFLKDPKKFQRLGGRIPKGVLMIGPPGTGKTLLARAIAGEADVPFFSISGSDFVEMFVGVGASRVRDLFEQGKKNAPCLIFIDEIDAVGRARGHGIGGGNDEREQTLNALLVEMDGFDTQEGVIIIAATNRKDVLDPALLRPGRFDREVNVNLPDVNGREKILQVHAKKVKLSAEVDLAVIARGTPGYSGAELANVINEAALLAARRNKDAIGQAELEEARDKVRWGRERRSLAMTEEEKRNTAYHEAGHALLNVLLEHTDPLHKVSIIPRGPALGVTMYLPEKDRYSMYQKQLRDLLCVIMGGRVAEELFTGDISSGASGDIRQASWYARKMVCEWGMSEHLGMVLYDEEGETIFLGREIGRPRSHSEKTQQEIDAEIKKLIDTAYQRAKDLIQQHRDALVKIAEALLEYETLDGSQVTDIVKLGHMRKPPAPRPPALPQQDPLPADTKPRKSSEEQNPEIPPGLTPSPIPS
jgi:cell division protease FtsH